MDPMAFVLGALAGALIGAFAAWLARGSRADAAMKEASAQRETEANDHRCRIELLGSQHSAAEVRAKQAETLQGEVRETAARLAAERERAARLETQCDEQRKAVAEQKVLLEKAEGKLTDVFKGLAADALDKNTAGFMRLANENLEKTQQAAKGELDQRRQSIEELVKPLKEQLARYEQQIKEMEIRRENAYGQMLAEVRILDDNQKLVGAETRRLVQALRAPQTRGRWGETTLRRLVDLAGMVDRCDFDEQVSVQGDEGRLIPDMVIRMPGGGVIVVDSKTPFKAFLEAIEADDPAAHDAALGRHADQVKAHMDNLSRKSYWSQFERAPEYVVMFVPGESFLSAAMQRQPDLFEYGLEKKVIVASPSFLLALLKTASLFYRQEQMAENAGRIQVEAQELYKRLATMGGHLEKMGSSLKKSVESYNAMIGSLERSVLPQARKLESYGIGARDTLELADQIEIEVRPLTADELTAK